MGLSPGGYFVADGALQLAITCTMPAGLPSAPYEIRVDYMAAARVRIASGSVEILPS